MAKKAENPRELTMGLSTDAIREMWEEGVLTREQVLRELAHRKRPKARALHAEIDPEGAARFQAAQPVSTPSRKSAKVKRESRKGKRARLNPKFPPLEDFEGPDTGRVLARIHAVAAQTEVREEAMRATGHPDFRAQLTAFLEAMEVAGFKLPADYDLASLIPDSYVY